jgi:hypothetical protein
MALTPYLAEFGAKLGQMLEKGDVKALQPQDSETQVGGGDEVEDSSLVVGIAGGGTLSRQRVLHSR